MTTASEITEQIENIADENQRLGEAIRKTLLTLRFDDFPVLHQYLEKFKENWETILALEEELARLGRRPVDTGEKRRISACSETSVSASAETSKKQRISTFAAAPLPEVKKEELKEESDEDVVGAL